MTILITGGAGFIGANFIDYYGRRHPEDRMVCLDKLTYAGNLASLKPWLDRRNFRFVRGDVCDREGVYRLFREERPEAVIHFAAESHVDRSIEDPEIFLRTNVLGTSVLLDACRDLGGIRFHQVSTDEVYGDLPLDRPDLRFTEASPIRTSSPYSASKAGADLLALAWHRTYGLPVTVSRCSNNYGPLQFPEKLIPRMIVRALAGLPLPVYGSGLHVRDWLYVEDHCAALDRILRQGRCGEVYNIGGNCEVPNLEIVRMICRRLDRPESLIAHVEDRKGHDLRYAVDAGKLREELGWRPETDLETGMDRTVRWYLEHRAWWEDILSGAYQERNQEQDQENSQKKRRNRP